MVYRYRNALIDDEKLRRRLDCLRPQRRRLVPIAIACLCATPFFVARIEESIGKYFWIGAGCLVSLLFVLQFVKEYRIVRNWAAAVGTMIWFQKIQGRRGSRAAIKYLFGALDGTLHLGNATASLQLAKNNKTLGVIYSRDNPSCSILLSQFWFYDFSPGATREGIHTPEVAPELKADS